MSSLAICCLQLSQSSDVDLLFTRAKAKGARRMNFEDFVSALGMVADKKVRSLSQSGLKSIHGVYCSPTH